MTMMQGFCQIENRETSRRELIIIIGFERENDIFKYVYTPCI